MGTIIKSRFYERILKLLEIHIFRKILFIFLYRTQVKIPVKVLE
ncbi:hypothetical protein LEP1GSC082_2961 [Leptospira kirschneri str. H2]|uniref:Uncharacterized protein n=2 Tax=Leptospira kirschneri TaxID=29507 RepID=A0A0E2B182_9LEPT|nr:hypothetical protein LEP1GSC081_1492 [Leptospira kirschneri str. H1]EKO61128.1 hypothetical protein LEP1GSC082_2961 [Leptospira kirschneri str. H2]EMK22702.1 hypothetical protein LEP1GSC008_0933 [Leptospira kirschneri serovar Bulgarica str. Nikolaevo]